MRWPTSPRPSRWLRRELGFFCDTFELPFPLESLRSGFSVAGLFVALAFGVGPAGVELPVFLSHLVTVLVAGLRFAALCAGF